MYSWKNITKKTITKVKKNRFLVVWNYLSIHYSKSSRFDQATSLALKIGHALIYGRKINFAQLIFDDLVAKITKKSRKSVPYSQFLNAILF
ncbi:hypothetical protein L6452_37039 [Arctium lappa]|uniref:Uncharacterized protein n=1 Tax=Arctium lappa TaxID=4217 RepID=A0ACB8Y1S7_ARCLA|nr:hypothetical protein L6452_37039 [Arctium lappa]